jgi:hypothetical protein
MLRSFKSALTDYLSPDVDSEKRIVTAAGGELLVGQCRSEDEVIQLVPNADGILNGNT